MKNRSESKNDFPVKSNFWSEIRSYIRSLFVAVALVFLAVYVGIGISTFITIWNAGNQTQLTLTATLILSFIIHQTKGTINANRRD